MKVNTVIVDDEKDARELLKIFLRDDNDIVLIDECQNGLEAINTINKTNPSLVFLDIQMPEVNGLEVINQLLAPYPYIIFVTAYDEFAIKAFELNAVDYILKPYSEERIKMAVNKVKKRLLYNDLGQISEQYKSILNLLKNSSTKEKEESYLQRIAVKTSMRTLFIDVEDVILIEACNQYIEVQTLEKKFLVRESMDNLEKVLNPNLFFRTHRSYIVNLKAVKALEMPSSKISSITLNNGLKVRLSNTKKSQFKRIMNL